jgi:predicted HTH transcriptional regulator
MNKIRVFISSVQSEFSRERALLFDYLRQDALLGQLFEPFMFERSAAKGESAQNVYLTEVKTCDVYIGLLGEKYGNEDECGVSPTEKEYNLAAELHKTRLIYIKKAESREEKMFALISKIEKEVVRKTFSDADELRTEIYASLIRYLEEKEIIRTSPFDATFCKTAVWEDLDKSKIKRFIRRARIKRSFPFNEETDDYKTVLSHLSLIKEERITNAAILLFGKRPQSFFITSSIKCCQFYGNDIVRPIPSYHIYDGDVFELIDQSVSFVMSRIDAKVYGRDKSVLADVEPELPLLAVTEAIVNAICHRDYTSNASVQVMLFKDRLEIWNPGQLPYGLTTETLKGNHDSKPANPLLARPMYLFGSIEQMGTGTKMILDLCKEQGLFPPKFQQEEIFKLCFLRKDSEAAEKKESKVTDKVTDKQEIILREMTDNPAVSTVELSAILNISLRKTKENISKLKSKGLVERVGTNKSGHWKVIQSVFQDSKKLNKRRFCGKVFERFCGVF